MRETIKTKEEKEFIVECGLDDVMEDAFDEIIKHHNIQLGVNPSTELLEALFNKALIDHKKFLDIKSGDIISIYTGTEVISVKQDDKAYDKNAINKFLENLSKGEK